MPHTSFEILHPVQLSSGTVFAAPHSGRVYPASFMRQSVLNAHQIRSSEDAFVDLLFESAPDHGAPLIRANVPRAFIDFNRDLDELDPALIHGADKRGMNPRVAAGLGVVPRVVAGARAIYSGKITMDAAQERIAQHWQPFHASLSELIAQAHAQFGCAILVDLHSMPHEALNSFALKNESRPDIVIGDRYGASADMDITTAAIEIFEAEGLRVARNTPFAGAFTLAHYGRPRAGCHAVQVEIDRSLYMNEGLIVPNDDFAAFQALCDRVSAQLAQLGRNIGGQLAAE